jgi:hypothetical protein
MMMLFIINLDRELDLQCMARIFSRFDLQFTHIPAVDCMRLSRLAGGLEGRWRRGSIVQLQLPA